ncbi:hypothetical protein Tco_0596312 [Tanacetum coccineum]
MGSRCGGVGGGDVQGFWQVNVAVLERACDSFFCHAAKICGIPQWMLERSSSSWFIGFDQFGTLGQERLSRRSHSQSSLTQPASNVRNVRRCIMDNRFEIVISTRYWRILLDKQFLPTSMLHKFLVLNECLGFAGPLLLNMLIKYLQVGLLALVTDNYSRIRGALERSGAEHSKRRKPKSTKLSPVAAAQNFKGISKA